MAEPPGRSRRWTGAALALFLAINLVLWACGNGIPYGYDSIETYWTFLIGHNAATFPHVNPLMADIAASPDASAHPYYYTHHPNLPPHLLSQGLIRIGLDTLPWHTLVAILISTFGLWAGARVLSRMVEPAVATAYVLISAFHYVGVLSWSHDLLRSMHFLFFWGVLLLLQIHLERPTVGRLIALAAAFFALFTCDYILAAFVSLVAFVLMISSRLSPGRKVLALSAMGLAASAAIAMWIGILVREFGPEVVRKDIEITYLARGARSYDQAQARDFYREHRMVYWGTTLSENRWELLARCYGTAFRVGHGHWVLLALTMLAVTAISPLFARMRGDPVRAAGEVAAIFLALLLLGVAAKCVIDRSFATKWLQARGVGWLPVFGAFAASSALLSLGLRAIFRRFPIAPAILIGSFLLFLIAAFREWRYAGYCAAFAATLVAVDWWLARRGITGWRRWVVLIGVFGLSAAIVVGSSKSIKRVDRYFVRWTALAVLGVTATVLAFFRRRLADGPALLSAFVRPAALASGFGLRAYVWALLAAIVPLSWFAIGPFTANFVHNYRPALVFLEDVLLAVLLVSAGRRVLAAEPHSPRRLVFATLFLACIAGWVTHQASMLRNNPPRELTGAAVLRRPEYRGAQTVTENMVAPVWYYTRGTTHCVTHPGNRDAFDFDSLMFFHDWPDRADLYRRPSLFVYLRQSYCESPKHGMKWVEDLRRMRSMPEEGRVLEAAGDYVIYRFCWP